MKQHNGFRLPAEWETQSAVILTWPHRHSDWAPILDRVEIVFVEITRQIALRQQAIICIYNEDHRKHVQRLLAIAGVPKKNFRLFAVASNDSWTRDHGPVTVVRADEIRLLDFQFNGWGGKYSAELDNEITCGLFEHGAFGSHKPESRDLVLEGGALETDGAGTLLTTRRCVLSSSRNTDLSEAKAEEFFTRELGISRTLWLNHGYLAGDDTDGHIDMLARFCNPETIVHLSCDDPDDEHYQKLGLMQQELAALRQMDGQPYELVPLPLPQAIYDHQGERLPASYANFLFINGAILLPVYGDPADKAATKTMAHLFPDREVIPINCRHLIDQFGSLHCCTMQLPAGLANSPD